MKGITENLAGRIAIIDLASLSQAELDDRADLVKPFMPTDSWIRGPRSRTILSLLCANLY